MNQAVTMPEAVAGAEMRRNALVLAVASSVMSANGTVTFSLGGLAGLYLLGSDKSLATLPLTGYTIGIALGAIPAAALMRRAGRRFGFRTGALVSILGGMIAGSAVLAGSFALLIVGLGAVGFANAFTQQYRFAAADGAGPQFRARAISWVLMGGVAAAVIGPQTVIVTRDLLLPIPFAGGFFAISGLGLVGLVVLSFLSGAARRPPPLVSRSGGRPLPEIVRQPRFIVALLCAMGSYSMMNLVMTAAPLAMVGCGLSQDDAALGIQWHVLAMFAPSFVTGSLIARFGKETIMAIGFALLAACGLVAIAGIDLLNFWAALILLGLGWNFSFIGATTMLPETYRPEEKAKVEGLNDFAVFGSVALASASSGKLFSSVGWGSLVLVIFPVVAICLLALSSTLFAARRRPV
jgi:MFS family permease